MFVVTEEIQEIKKTNFQFYPCIWFIMSFQIYTVYILKSHHIALLHNSFLAFFTIKLLKNNATKKLKNHSITFIFFLFTLF